MSMSFTDPNLWLEDFALTFDVICPDCSNIALVKRSESIPYGARFTCNSCGKSRDWKGTSSIVMRSSIAPKDSVVCYGGSFDAFFHYPLFLSISCCGEDLWAYNEGHLDFLIGYVEADHRKSNPEFGGNKTLASRLPKWMISKKNRGRVLRSLCTLRSNLQNRVRTSV